MYQVGQYPESSTNGRVAEGLPEFLLDLLRDIGTVEVLALGVERLDAEL